MVAQTAVVAATSTSLRRRWLTATLVATISGPLLAIALSPSTGVSPTRALSALLFVSTSAHVAATAWFYTDTRVRTYAASHPIRYVVAPAALLLGGALVAAVLTPHSLRWLLLPFFAWQFFHFQKQNLGIAALTASAYGVRPLSKRERIALGASGVAAIVGLLAHPELLQLTTHTHVRFAFPLALVFFVASALFGLAEVRRRSPTDRPAAFALVYILSLVFFLPIFLFHSPYAAVAGVTIAHGLQYLVLMWLVAGAQRTDATPRIVGVLVLVNIALLGGLALNRSAHLHDGGAGLRLLYGVFLGVNMAHFVIDAGLWRLRDAFPRRYLAAALPYLVRPRG